jgi:hypothetical protein
MVIANSFALPLFSLVTRDGPVPDRNISRGRGAPQTAESSTRQHDKTLEHINSCFFRSEFDEHPSFARDIVASLVNITQGIAAETSKKE